MADNDLLIVAGEASGDLYGARMLDELRRLSPDLRAFGLGGDELHSAGLDSEAHSSEIAVVGLTEVLGVLRRAREVFAGLLEQVDARRPAAAVLIDAPEFNLRMARELKRRGVPVVYYVSPQIWAWRRRRVRQIARRVEKMLVLFGFEVEFYREHDVSAVHVGHPLVDIVPTLEHAWERESNPERFEIALLPGSRRSETRRLLPILLQAASRIGREVPARFRLIRAPNVPEEELRAALEGSELDVEVVSDGRFEALSGSHLALCASGTATLEVGLVGTPMVVVYRVGRLTGWLGRRLVRLPRFALVNLVLGRTVFPELLQSEATPERIHAETVRLLADRESLGEMRSALAELRGRLGRPGASRRAAAEVHSVLCQEVPA